MSEDDTEFRPKSGHQVPVALTASSERPSLLRNAPPAAFVSQLLAERQHLTVQRAKRRASVDVAVDAYRTGAGIAHRRMPQGYRRTVLA